MVVVMEGRRPDFDKIAEVGGKVALGGELYASKVKYQLNRSVVWLRNLRDGRIFDYGDPASDQRVYFIFKRAEAVWVCLEERNGLEGCNFSVRMYELTRLKMYPSRVPRWGGEHSKAETKQIQGQLQTCRLVHNWRECF